MNCDLCGKEAELFKAIVEGSEMTVCHGCGGYGKVIGKVQIAVEEKKKNKPVMQTTEAMEDVVSNFGELLKRKREELGLNQKDFASKIAEKESILHKLETGAIVPTLERARKLEKMLGLKLVEELKDEPVTQQKSSAEMTLGDMIKIKKRKGN
ncbi:TIGR00270 family protein [Candidatus Woesearchaeota archaeon]|nr:TIGR00270 family protein [Candidatus Woesearchaeota archaeon]|tara:strand:- start:178 stop:636 length:459 start_codon:yes stop_codon:yes gene_type:complete